MADIKIVNIYHFKTDHYEKSCFPFNHFGSITII